MADRRSTRRAAELHDLQMVEARWRALWNLARDAIVSIDAKGVVTLFNPVAERIFGYAASEVIGQNVGLLMPSPYREEHDEYIRRYQRTGDPHAIGRIRAVRGRRKSGETFPLELSVSESHLGDEVLYTAILRDVSAERELQRLANERARLADIGAITAKIVHDLGNPLAALSMQAQLVLRRARRGDLTPVEKIEEPAQQILQTLRRLEGLVHEFMEFAREQRLVIHAFEILPFLNSCANVWQPLAAERGITLRAVDESGNVELHADEMMLRRVLDNLIKNAIEAIGSGPGEVVVRAGLPAAEKIHLIVEDSGIGVAPGVDVFKLFETTKPDGTGIGLAVAKQIVTAHGGVIDHAPRAPRGTRFRVELPLGGPMRV